MNSDQVKFKHRVVRHQCTFVNSAYLQDASFCKVIFLLQGKSTYCSCPSSGSFAVGVFQVTTVECVPQSAKYSSFPGPLQDANVGDWLGMAGCPII